MFKQSLDSFDGENQVRVGSDWTDCSASISCFSWAQYFNFGTDFHVDSDFIPTFNDLTDSNVEIKWLSTVVTWIELCSVFQGSFIMHVDFLSLNWSSSGLSLSKDFDGVLRYEIFSKSWECWKDSQSCEKNSFHYKQRVVIIINL